MSFAWCCRLHFRVKAYSLARKDGYIPVSRFSTCLIHSRARTGEAEQTTWMLKI
nr:MAG TPA: hypothetical protein [Caudoviricetes sp.]